MSSFLHHPPHPNSQERQEPLNDIPSLQGILLLNKPTDCSSFSLVSILRKILHIRTIGHAGPLDPFATGVMVMLIGREYTKRSSEFLSCDKEYIAEIRLGISTTTYDCDGEVTGGTMQVPTREDVDDAIAHFQGEILQIPPMFSAKKMGGKKLCDLARKGIELERPPCKVNMTLSIISYIYPYLLTRIICSKGTYVRSIAHDLGNLLGTGAHLTRLERIRSGKFALVDCLDVPGLTKEKVAKHLIF